MINKSRLDAIKRALKDYPFFEFLGKGKRGEVYKINDVLVVKIERDDIDAFNTIKNEYDMLKRLERYKYFPKPKMYDDKLRFIIRELVKGETISKKINKTIVKEGLLMSYCLDKEKINQGELTNPFKHIFSDNNKIMMIDFERAKITENPKNVSQFIQYIRSRFGIESEELTKLVRDYKEEYNKKVLNKILLLLLKTDFIH